jgi:hypothetical protein
VTSTARHKRQIETARKSEARLNIGWRDAIGYRSGRHRIETRIKKPTRNRIL